LSKKRFNEEKGYTEKRHRQAVDGYVSMWGLELIKFRPRQDLNLRPLDGCNLLEFSFFEPRGLSFFSAKRKKGAVTVERSTN
jgi:hypothetical protein